MNKMLLISKPVCVYRDKHIFFFKQKTAYEMRISDWSSDVCSSDLHRLHRARHLEGVIDTAPCRCADRLHGAFLCGIKGVGGAELAGQRQLVVEDVDGNDALGAGQARAEQRGEADAAEADHGDRTAGADETGRAACGEGGGQYG